MTITPELDQLTKRLREALHGWRCHCRSGDVTVLDQFVACTTPYLALRGGDPTMLPCAGGKPVLYARVPRMVMAWHGLANVVRCYWDAVRLGTHAPAKLGCMVKWCEDIAAKGFSGMSVVGDDVRGFGLAWNGARDLCPPYASTPQATSPAASLKTNSALPPARLPVKPS